MNELWQPVLGWEEHYEVSNLSRCRSIGRWLERRNKSRELYAYWRNGQLLKPSLVDYGNGTTYLKVTLKINGRQWSRLLHKLMWEAFNGPVPDHLYVLHGTAKGEERHLLGNLSIGTHSDNMRDRLRDGTDNRGTKHYACKLNEEAIRIIRAHPKGYGTGRALAKRFGVGESVISTVRSGGAWTHLH